MWAGMAQSVWGIAMEWMVRGSNVVRVKIFSASPDGCWNQASLLYHGYRIYFPRVKRPKRRVDQSPPSRGDVKE